MALSPASPQAVAVVLDGPPTPAWQGRALAALGAREDLDVVAVRLVAPAHAGRLLRTRVALERRLFGVGADATAPGPAVAPFEGGEPAAVVWLAEGAPPPAPGEAGTARVLRLRHAGAAGPLGAAFARAVARGDRTVATELLCDAPGGGAPTVVARTRSGVRPFSAVLSAHFAANKLAALVGRAAGCDEAGPAAAPDVAPPPAPAGEPALLALTLARWARITANRARHRRPWEVEVRRRRADPVAGWREGSDVQVPWLPGHVYADPFLFEHEGRHHLFVEDVPPGAPHGVISHVALDGAGVADGPPRPVLEAPHHLSYPYVFAHDGDVFLIPETLAARRVELHRAVRFPDRWERVAILLDDVDAVDATVFAHEGRWWMFVAIAAPGASTLDELHLLHAPDPRGPWTPHPANPVVSDATCARPAGAVLREEGGRLLRPGQDGARRYGEAISLRAIDVLTPQAYAEHEVARLGPGDVRDALATHTITRDSAFEAIDVRRRRPRRRRRLDT